MRRITFAVVLAAASIHCGSSSEPAASEEVGTAAEPLLTHCYAEIERPSPTAATLSIGTALTLRTNPNLVCPEGVTESLVYRFYVEGPSGIAYSTPAGTWSTSRLVPIDTSTFAAGRYRIYAYSLPASMVAAWQANDATARAASHRSGYTYVTFLQGSNTLVAAGTSFTVVPNSSWECDPEEGGCWIWAYEPNDAWELGIGFVTAPSTTGDYAIWDGTWPQPATSVATYFWRQAGFATFSAATGAVHVTQGGDGHLHVTFAGTAAGGQSETLSMGFDFVLPDPA